MTTFIRLTLITECALLLSCAVAAASVPNPLVAKLAERSVFPLATAEVRGLFSADESGRVRDVPFERPADLTFHRWDSQDGRCYAEFSPSPADYARVERVQLGCLYDTRAEAAAALKDWVGTVDRKVASRLRLGRNGPHYSYHRGRARDGSNMSIEVRLDRDDEGKWGADLVFLDVYPPAYVH